MKKLVLTVCFATFFALGSQAQFKNISEVADVEVGEVVKISDMKRLTPRLYGSKETGYCLTAFQPKLIGSRIDVQYFTPDFKPGRITRLKPAEKYRKVTVISALVLEEKGIIRFVLSGILNGRGEVFTQDYDTKAQKPIPRLKTLMTFKTGLFVESDREGFVLNSSPNGEYHVLTVSRKATWSILFKDKTKMLVFNNKGEKVYERGYKVGGKLFDIEDVRVWDDASLSLFVHSIVKGEGGKSFEPKIINCNNKGEEVNSVILRSGDKFGYSGNIAPYSETEIVCAGHYTETKKRLLIFEKEFMKGVFFSKINIKTGEVTAFEFNSLGTIDKDRKVSFKFQPLRQTRDLSKTANGYAMYMRGISFYHVNSAPGPNGDIPASTYRVYAACPNLYFLNNEGKMTGNMMLRVADDLRVVPDIVQSLSLSTAVKQDDYFLFTALHSNFFENTRVYSGLSRKGHSIAVLMKFDKTGKAVYYDLLGQKDMSPKKRLQILPNTLLKTGEDTYAIAFKDLKSVRLALIKLK